MPCGTYRRHVKYNNCKQLNMQIRQLIVFTV